MMPPLQMLQDASLCIQNLSAQCRQLACVMCKLCFWYTVQCKNSRKFAAVDLAGCCMCHMLEERSMQTDFQYTATEGRADQSSNCAEE